MSECWERADQLTGYSVSGVTILLSLTVFLNLVAETLPQVSDAIPLLGSDAVWCVTDSGLLSDTWIVGGGLAYTLFFQFDGLLTQLVINCRCLLFFYNFVFIWCATLLFVCLCPGFCYLPVLSVILFVPGVTILLSLTVFSLLVAQVLPQTSDAVPLIG